MKKAFLNIKDHNDLASFFGITYTALSKVLYKYSGSCKYKTFEIPKKNGGTRVIKAPCRKLKYVQHILKDVLYEIYPVRPSVYGFVRDRSIVDNAKRHLSKKFIFNVDLKNFFPSIHYGRVRRLFKAPPFNFNDSVSAILAQICCVDNSLPQGAPTSPIVSNMIAWKLDAQLQKLAQQGNSTYTRYADDITFSFSCRKKLLPSDIVKLDNDGVALPGSKLAQIITENGFEINQDKVRLAGVNQRMEVTGLTVNDFPNVGRKYVRQISSILNAWRKYGYDAAEKELNSKFYKKHRPSGGEVSLVYFLKGKLSFFLSVRGQDDCLYNKLAVQYNELLDKDFANNELKFKIFEVPEPDVNVVGSLWIIETCYDDPESGEPVASQGTGFSLCDVGIITCAHVVSDGDNIYEGLEVFKYNAFAKKYNLEVVAIDHHLDIAICKIADNGFSATDNQLIVSELEITHKTAMKLFGFPAYKIGQSYYVSDCNVATTYTQSGVKKFEINHPIREGNSGGPVVDLEGKLVGIALEGATKSSGSNGVLCVAELVKYVKTCVAAQQAVVEDNSNIITIPA